MMAGHSRSGRRRRRGGHAAEHENEERWLLTYADMITLLMALFIVMFAISSVNVSKYKTLQETLKEAFSGKVLPGGKSVLKEQPSAHPKQAPTPSPSTSENDQFQVIKQQLDSYSKAHGLKSQIETSITRRGLVVRLLTDKVLFDSGQAVLKPRAHGILDKVAGLLSREKTHPIQVEGHTDDIPIRNSVYPTNWELSTARASSVVRYLISQGLDARRLGAAGYAQLHPIAPNTTGAGRQRNRRVEIVLLRVNDAGQAGAQP